MSEIMDGPHRLLNTAVDYDGELNLKITDGPHHLLNTAVGDDNQPRGIPLTFDPNPPALTAGPPLDYILTINSNTEPLVTISLDGTVTIHKYGAEEEAAKIFWSTIQFHGQHLITQRDRLLVQVKELEARVQELAEERC